VFYRHVSSALPFVPLSVESFGRLGARTVSLFGRWPTLRCRLVGLAARAAFISRAFQELSVTLCCGNASLCRSGSHFAAGALVASWWV
jgi:hypothetical protein